MKESSERLCSYMDANEKFLNLSAIARAVGTNAGNMAKYRAVRQIPEKYRQPLEAIFLGLSYVSNLLNMVKPLPMIQKTEPAFMAKAMEGREGEPVQRAGESSLDFRIRLGEWREGKD